MNGTNFIDVRTGKPASREDRLVASGLHSRVLAAMRDVVVERTDAIGDARCGIPFRSLASTGQCRCWSRSIRQPIHRRSCRVRPSRKKWSPITRRSVCH